MKPCPFCAEPIQDQAIKCRFCNSMLDGSAPPSPLAPRGQQAPAPTATTMIFEGSPSWKAWFWSYALMVIVALGVIAGAWAEFLGRFVPWRFALPGLGALVLADLLWLGAVHLVRRSMR